MGLIEELRAALADDPETGPVATIAPDCGRLAAALEAEEARVSPISPPTPGKPARTNREPRRGMGSQCHTSRTYEPLTRA
jgi:hypothetical protein